VSVPNPKSRVAGPASSRVPSPSSKARVSAPETQATRLDRLIHDRVRLGILSALAASSEVSFGDLKAALELTDGNLSVHARKLEEAGYIVCRKSFNDRTPRTEYAMTSTGRRAFEKYLDHMDAIIEATRGKKNK
jgi:DNA-binding HxlR family transcriptional regulator